MDNKQFIATFRMAFGEAAPLPIAIGYSTKPATEVKKIARCMVGAIRKVCDGDPLTLSAENVLCGGGSFYTAFAPLQERIPVYVSETERYRQTKEQVQDTLDRLEVRLSEKPYLNFVRIDQLDNFDDVEAILFFANPDILSGLCFWAFYDNDADDAVTAQFASGCCGMITLPVKENERGGRRCFIGMLDPSARPLIPKDELSFAIPMCRFKEMLLTMQDTSLFQKAYTILKKRIK